MECSYPFSSSFVNCVEGGGWGTKPPSTLFLKKGKQTRCMVFHFNFFISWLIALLTMVLSSILYRMVIWNCICTACLILILFLGDVYCRFTNFPFKFGFLVRWWWFNLSTNIGFWNGCFNFWSLLSGLLFFFLWFGEELNWWVLRAS